MKHILTVATLLLVFSAPVSAGEIPQPKDCPPNVVCPKQTAPPEAPIEEPEPEPELGLASTTILAKAVSLLMSGIVAVLN